MSEILQSVRGMSDVLPAETPAWLLAPPPVELLLPVEWLLLIPALTPALTPTSATTIPTSPLTPALTPALMPLLFDSLAPCDHDEDSPACRLSPSE